MYLQARPDKTYSSNPTLASAPFRFTRQTNTPCRDISWLFFQFLDPYPFTELSDRGNQRLLKEFTLVLYILILYFTY